MATGDLTNNVRKLKTKLRLIKYTEDIDISGITEGKPTVYLPIYHYAFTQFSPPLAKLILEKDIELFGKSDSRFMEAIYKILRDIFSYKPPIIKDQFFSKGFAELKVIMCTDVLQHVITKNTALRPKASKTSMKTSIRPASAAETKNMPMGVPKTKRPSSSRGPPRAQPNGSKPQTSPRQATQVINELTSEPPHQLVRHTSQPISSMTMTRHIARSPDKGEPDLMKNLPSRATKMVVIQSPRREDSSDDTDSFDFSPEPTRGNLIPKTPSIKMACPRSVEVVSMPRVEEVHDQSAIEIRAVTSESILNSTVPTLEADVHFQISNMYQSMQTLTEQVMNIDSSMKELKMSKVAADPYIQALEQKIQCQIDNLMARMVLVENRVSIVEAKVDDHNINMFPPANPSTIPAAFNQANLPAPSFSEDLKSLSAVHKFQEVLNEHSNYSLGYSPIRKITTGVHGEMMSGNEDTFAMETEDDARRSSTPTGGEGRSLLGESSLCCNFSDPETNDAVSRIKNMMKETKTILADQNRQPENGATS